MWNAVWLDDEVRNRSMFGNIQMHMFLLMFSRVYLNLKFFKLQLFIYTYVYLVIKGNGRRAVVVRSAHCHSAAEANGEPLINFMIYCIYTHI